MEKGRIIYLNGVTSSGKTSIRSVSGNDRGRVPEGELLEIPW